jgi:hypothetical protein
MEPVAEVEMTLSADTPPEDNVRSRPKETYERRTGRPVVTQPV